MSLSDATLLGKVIFLDGKVGGRKVPIQSGYRGQFFYNGMDCDAVHMFDIPGAVPFGQEVIDYIYLPNPVHRSHIKAGMMFLIREGPHTIGYGQISQILPEK